VENKELTMITNRGIKVWPNGFEETYCTGPLRCRFKPKNGKNYFKKSNNTYYPWFRCKKK
jgi:isocitrate dehydrogenase